MMNIMIIIIIIDDSSSRHNNNINSNKIAQFCTSSRTRSMKRHNEYCIYTSSHNNG